MRLNRAKSFDIVYCLYFTIVEEEVGKARREGEFTENKIHTFCSVPWSRFFYKVFHKVACCRHANFVNMNPFIVTVVSYPFNIAVSNLLFLVFKIRIYIIDWLIIIDLSHLSRVPLILETIVVTKAFGKNVLFLKTKFTKRYWLPKRKM